MFMSSYLGTENEQQYIYISPHGSETYPYYLNQRIDVLICHPLGLLIDFFIALSDFLEF